MIANAPPVHTSRNPQSVLPPWTWFWLVLYLLGLPALFEQQKSELLVLLFGNDGTGMTYNFAERWVHAGFVASNLFLLLSVLAVFLPWLRTRYLERTYKVTEIDKLPVYTLDVTLQALEEIRQFVALHAPYLLIKCSSELKDYAFVYPVGYRRAGLVVSLLLAAEWRTDKQQAQAILLHEIAHYRHGDAFVLGAGSPVQAAAKYLPLYNAIFVFVPVLLSLIVEHVQSFREELALTPDVQRILGFHLQQALTFDLPNLLLAVLQSLFYTLTIVTIVLATIWCAELNADRFVADSMQDRRVLASLTMSNAIATSWWERALGLIAHPPLKLRCWLLRHSFSQMGAVLLLVFFPLAWFVRLLALCGWALSRLLLFLYSGVQIGFIGEVLSRSVANYLKATIPAWLAIALVLVLWPFMARLWERFFTRLRGQSRGINYRSYALAAVFVVCICLCGFILAQLAPPDQTASAAGNGPLGTGDATKTVASPVASRNGLPQLQGAYKGRLVNTTAGSNVEASATLSAVKQDAQGKLTGYMSIQLPLAGSGPFTGSVTSDGTLQFTVTPDDGSGYAAIQFQGVLHPDGTMDGTYTLPDTGQGGTWRFATQ